MNAKIIVLSAGGLEESLRATAAIAKALSRNGVAVGQIYSLCQQAEEVAAAVRVAAEAGEKAVVMVPEVERAGLLAKSAEDLRAIAAAIEQGDVDLDLTPSASKAEIADAILEAAGVAIAKPQPQLPPGRPPGGEPPKV